MSIRVLQALAGLFALAAVLLVLVGWRLASSVSQQTSVPGSIDSTGTVDNSAVAPVYPALVALNEMPSGHLVREQDLVLVDMPFAVPEGISDNKELVGNLLSRPVKAGSIVRQSDVEVLPGVGSEVQSGMRGVAIAIDEIVGVGSHLSPGDLVDVHFVTAANASRQSSLGRTLFKNIRVLSVGSEYLLSEAPDDAGITRSARSVVLEVPQKLSPLLTLAETSGVLRLALIGYDEVHDRKLQANLTDDEDLSVISAGLSVLSSDNSFQLSDLSTHPANGSQRQTNTGESESAAEEILVIKQVGNEVSRINLVD